MQIDLGGDARKTCRACGMEYVPSSMEDTSLHKEYCGMNLAGIELGKTFVKDDTLREIRFGRILRSATHRTVSVDRRSSAIVKSKVKDILHVVNTELSAADIDEEALWREPSEIIVGNRPGHKRKGTPSQNEVPYDRFKAFLHISGDRCIGICLAEKINQAFTVCESGFEDEEKPGELVSSSVSHTRSAQLSLLGISRIWVSKAFRERGIAKSLLEAAQHNYFYGIQVPRNLIAFSQPTESGKQLAKRFFGAKDDWHVYTSQTC